MKIDIRDEVNTSEITGITFAEQDDSTNPQYVEVATTCIGIKCAASASCVSIVALENIPNLIKALQKVCELKGIK